MLGVIQRSTYGLKPLTLFLIELLIVTTIIGYFNIKEIAFASPVFPGRVIIDDANDGINVVNNSMATLQDNSSDILAVTYFSTGKTFNATFWLQGTFDEKDPSPGSNISKQSYGMFIDTDFDKNPNYRTELQKFQNRTWVEAIREIEPHHPLNQKSIAHRFFDINYNYTNFHANKERFVYLTFDLSSIGYPDKYEVSFYTEQRVGCPNDPPCNNVIYDVTNWVLIPPPKISLTLSPNPLLIRPGEIKPINVEVNSTWDFTVSAVNKTEGIVFLNHNGSYSPSQIPQIMVKVPDAVKSSSSFVIPISVNAAFSTDSLFEIRTSEEPNEPRVENEPRDIITEVSNLKVNVGEHYNYLDYLSTFNNTVIAPISGIWTFLLGVLAISVPWLLRGYRQRQKNRYQSKLPD